MCFRPSKSPVSQPGCNGFDVAVKPDFWTVWITYPPLFGINYLMLTFVGKKTNSHREKMSTWVCYHLFLSGNNLPHLISVARMCARTGLASPM